MGEEVVAGVAAWGRYGVGVYESGDVGCESSMAGLVGVSGAYEGASCRVLGDVVRAGGASELVAGAGYWAVA